MPMTENGAMVMTSCQLLPSIAPVIQYRTSSPDSFKIMMACVMEERNRCTAIPDNASLTGVIPPDEAIMYTIAPPAAAPAKANTTEE